MRIFLGVVLLAIGCKRTGEPPKPRAMAEPVDAASDATVAVGDAAPAPRSTSMFALVARAPYGAGGPVESDVAAALPLVQRIGDGGLAVASEYGRATNLGPGALTVDVASDDDFDVYFRSGDVQGHQLIRWVWTDGKASIGSYENATMRNGPEIGSFTVGPKDAFKLRRNAGYWDAVVRDGSVLALERVTHDVPGPQQDSTASELSPARVVVLRGKAPAPVLPAGVCPKGMAAGPDGALVVVVDKCKGGDELGLLRYPPQKTTATPEWVTIQAGDPSDPPPVEIAVASANESYVGYADTLETWNGKVWTASTPFDGDRVISLSAGTDGALWAVARRSAAGDGGYVTVRKPGGARWDDVVLPPAPTTPLDDVAYRAPTTNEMTFRKAAPDPSADRGAFTPRKVDAAGAELLVLATVDREAFVFSSVPRAPVARIPSIDTQRAQLAKGYKRKTTTLAKAGKGCLESFLVFPSGTKPEALGLGAPADGGPELVAAEATVEGKPELVVYTMNRFTNADIDVAAKRFAALSPKRVCGPPVIERDY